MSKALLDGSLDDFMKVAKKSGGKKGAGKKAMKAAKGAGKKAMKTGS